ncbi:MAG: hypothetical protein J4400_03280 [Candidatus Aenigmarchaeota archaeon]|nr:hypothetical protein [Candidatus Aenigmarchaeota archaeon]
MNRPRLVYVGNDMKEIHHVPLTDGDIIATCRGYRADFWREWSNADTVVYNFMPKDDRKPEDG